MNEMLRFAGGDGMPEWLRNQLRRAFQNHDARAIQMLNRAFYQHRIASRASVNQ